MTSHPDPNSAAQAATQHPIDEAIVILSAEAESIRECHTPGSDRNAWTGESEARAAHDNMLRVAAALSALRTAVADERAVTAPLCHVRPVGDGWQVCPSTHQDARPVSATDAPHDSDSVCAWRVWWNQHKSQFTTARQASFAAFAAGKEWRDAALAGAPVPDAWQQYAMQGEMTAEQVCKRLDEEVTRRTVDAMRRSDEAQEARDEIERLRAALASTPVAVEAVNADFLASWEAQRHAGNEWADMATNGIQWMRNVKDGISTPEKALECLASDLAHCRATQARAGITPPAAPQASAEDAVTPPADVAQLVAFIFDRFGQPGDAGALPDNVAAAVRRLERGIKAQAGKDGGHQHAGEVLFWYRPRSDGWYEGPIHNDRIEEARKRSGAWVPLIAAPQANAKDVHNAALEKAARLMEQTGKRIAASDIRALKTQADRDGEACAKGDGNV